MTFWARVVLFEAGAIIFVVGMVWGLCYRHDS